MLPSELPDGHQRGEGGHRLPRPRAMAPSSRQNCLWPARQRAGHAGEAGAGGKGNAERKAKGLFGARAALEGARPECPPGHRRPPGATELGTAWLQEVWGHLLLGHGHPVCPSSGTSWWAILGPAAFPPLAITLPQRRLGCPPPGSLPGLRWGRDLPGLEQPPFSGLEESWCDPGGASSGGGCQGNAGGRRKWALTAPPPRSWGRQGLPLLDAHPPLAALLRAAWGCGELWAEWAQWAGPHSPRLLPPSRGLGSLLAMSAVCLPPGCRGLPGQHQHQHRAGRRLRRKEEGAEDRAEPAAGRGGSHTALSLSLSPCPLRPALGLAKLSVYASGRWGGSFCVLPGPGPRNPPNTHCLLGSLGLRGSRS